MLLLKLNALTNLIAFIVGIFYYKYFTKEIKTVFYFVVFGVLTESYMRLHQYYIMKNTMPVGYFYFPVAILIAGIFYVQVLKDFLKPVYIYIIIILYEIYCIINPLFIQSWFEYPSVEGSIGSIIIFLFSIAYFTKIMVEAKLVKLSKEPLVWINTAFLIYYTGNFFYHSLYNLRIKASIDVAFLALILFSILNLLFYLILAVTFTMTKRSVVGNHAKYK
jgi:hypothetical protein